MPKYLRKTLHLKRDAQVPFKKLSKIPKKGEKRRGRKKLTDFDPDSES